MISLFERIEIHRNKVHETLARIKSDLMFDENFQKKENDFKRCKERLINSMFKIVM